MELISSDMDQPIKNNGSYLCSNLQLMNLCLILHLVVSDKMICATLEEKLKDFCYRFQCL